MRYFVRVLPNGNVYVRNLDSENATVIKLGALSEHIKKEREEKAQDAEDEASDSTKTK